MKKGTIILAFAIGMILSCDKLAELIQANFNINPNDIRFTVKKIESANSSYSIEGNEYLNVDSMIQAKEKRLSISNIKEAKISKIEISIPNHTNGDTVNSLKNLNTLKVEFKTDLNSNYELVKELNASDITSENMTTVELSPAFDVLSKVKASKNFYYRFTASNKSATTKDIEMSAKLTYSIKAGL